MNIHLDSIHLPSFFSGTQNNIMGELHCHFVRSMQILSNYMRYNELTLAGSVFGINLMLIAGAEKTMDYTSPLFQGDFFQRAWVRHSSSLIFKSVFAGTFLYGINRLMNLQLNNTLIAISVIASLALKALWQNVICPDSDISSFWKGNGKVEEAKSELATEKKAVEEEREDEPQLIEEEEEAVPKATDLAETNKIEIVKKIAEESQDDENKEIDDPESPRENVLAEKEALNELKEGRESPLTEEEEKGKSFGVTPVPSGGAESMLESAPFLGTIDNLEERFGRKPKRE